MGFSLQCKTSSLRESERSIPAPFSALSPSVSKLYLFLSLPVCPRSSLLTEEGEGMGEEPNHITAREPGSQYIIQYSLVPPQRLPGYSFHQLSHIQSQTSVTIWVSF
jgi:hypothetical protein